MTIQITNKKEFEAKLAILRELAHEAADRFRDIAKENQVARVDRWKKAGGCQKCRGRGQYVVWDTLDSLSGCYAEFAHCKECTGDSRLLGPSPDVVGKYDRVGGTAAKVEAAINQWGSSVERILEGTASEESAKAWATIESLQHQYGMHHSPDNGKEMIVIRGWKHIKRGMRGIVFWQRGNRVGLRLDDERCEKGFYKNTLWCNESQLGNPVPFIA
jgi:hypothetical protein